jgi:hypothetical protein
MRARIDLSKRYLHVILRWRPSELRQVFAEVRKGTRLGFVASSLYSILWLLMGGLGAKSGSERRAADPAVERANRAVALAG